MQSANDYVKHLSAALAKGNATEHTYRPALKTFIESLGKGLMATNEPRRIACGAPGRVWINADQCFEGVALEVWDFHVGGYQVAQKWLKDRKGRTLTHDDLNHYRQTIAALSETIRLMAEVEEAIETTGGWPLQ